MKMKRAQSGVRPSLGLAAMMTTWRANAPTATAGPE